MNTITDVNFVFNVLNEDNLNLIKKKSRSFIPIKANKKWYRKQAKQLVLKVRFDEDFTKDEINSLVKVCDESAKDLMHVKCSDVEYVGSEIVNR